MNKNASSYVCFVDSIDLWHAGLWQVNFSYVKKMKQLGLITSNNNTCMQKCDVCAESKQTKKSCASIFRESKLLSLIHTDLGDLKQCMTRGGKRYYVTFIDDYSRFTKT